MAATLSKNERLHFRDDINALVKNGRWLNCHILKVQYAPMALEEGCRIMVSVPKRNFKKAVARNLLKRRIREAYRLNKEMFTPLGMDLLIYYKSKETATFEEIEKELLTVCGILKEKQ